MTCGSSVAYFFLRIGREERQKKGRKEGRKEGKEREKEYSPQREFCHHP